MWQSTEIVQEVYFFPYLGQEHKGKNSKTSFFILIVAPITTGK